MKQGMTVACSRSLMSSDAISTASQSAWSIDPNLMWSFSSNCIAASSGKATAWTVTPPYSHNAANLWLHRFRSVIRCLPRYGSVGLSIKGPTECSLFSNALTNGSAHQTLLMNTTHCKGQAGVIEIFFNRLQKEVKEKGKE